MSYESLDFVFARYFADGAAAPQLRQLAAHHDCDCNCDDLLENIFELLDRELSAAAALRLLAHAKNCPECVEHLSSEQRIRELMRKSVADTAPAALRVRITETFAQFLQK
ncbi:mycothiol system anti-sigma-R factor [Arcanobacterium hippocoleae]|uniref:Mycothiol system anti-sigma-R factor n=1 Tax=Arcanobacterium hippocoleae TaxID=149017 RepID=A0ABU1T3K0_9ACTO|nr:mycothiol system anti-sigma-R factor [Arcanobacterium hippocoleae]MDR6939962.1 mycothiol system anti-sigma-R factor [Arcanobacterium hippocoleae]